jgi:hypothetical protein
MIRIQLHLNEAQDRRLRALAKRTNKTRAELIRQAIELLFRDAGGASDPLLALVGAAGPAGRDDVSEQHDALLYAADSKRASWRPKSS